jgi:hypothetical protein
MPVLRIMLGCTNLGSVVAVIDGCLQAPSQCALGITSSQKLSDLSIKLSHFGFSDLGLWGVEGRDIEVETGVLGQGINVDRSPSVAQRGVGVLLND